METGILARETSRRLLRYADSQPHVATPPTCCIGEAGKGKSLKIGSNRIRTGKHNTTEAGEGCILRVSRGRVGERWRREGGERCHPERGGVPRAWTTGRKEQKRIALAARPCCTLIAYMSIIISTSLPPLPPSARSAHLARVRCGDVEASI